MPSRQVGFFGWRQLLSVMVPILVGALAILSATSAFLVWSTHRIDEASVDRQKSVIATAFRSARAQIGHQQESSTIWDEAAERVTDPTSIQWIDDSLGGWMHDYFGLDELYVLDRGDRPTFASTEGKRREPSAYEPRRRVVAPLAVALRAKLAAGEGPDGASQERSPSASDFALVDRRPAIVSVKPIIADVADLAARRSDVYLHVAIRYLDGSYLDQLAGGYGLEDLHFSWARRELPGDAGLPLVNARGITLGYFLWQPFEPGSIFLKSVGPVLVALAAGAVLLIVALVLALVRRRLRDRHNEARIRYLAHHDSLTGLPNRAAFEARSDALISECMERGRTLGLFYLDLDRFKQVNDTLGHSAGDRVIVGVAGRLAGILGGNGELFRLGGDEFVALVPDWQPEEMEGLCREMISAVEPPFTLAGGEAYIGLSIGLALAPMHGGDRHELTRKADVALYDAKAAGRGRHATFAAHMDRAVRDQAVLERDLRQALDGGGGIIVRYQPKFDGRDGGVVGVEARACWLHPDRGALPPEVFLAVAAQAGLADVLGRRILAVACRAAVAWPIAHLAIAVSPAELRDRAYPGRVREVLAETGLAPSRLEIEIAEAAWLAAPDVCRVVAAELRAMGVRLALGAFGTGFSIFERSPGGEIDRIKIDRRFVGGLGRASNDEAIVKAIVELARSRGLRTTADGVEDGGQSELLRALGCEELQGLRLGGPMSAEAMTALLAGLSGGLDAACGG